MEGKLKASTMFLSVGALATAILVSTHVTTEEISKEPWICFATEELHRASKGVFAANELSELSAQFDWVAGANSSHDTLNVTTKAVFISASATDYNISLIYSGHIEENADGALAYFPTARQYRGFIRSGGDQCLIDIEGKQSCGWRSIEDNIFERLFLPKLSNLINVVLPGMNYDAPGGFEVNMFDCSKIPT